MTRLCRAVFFFLVCIVLSGCAGESYAVPRFKLRYGTAGERRESLTALREAWRERPDEINVGACLYERAVLNRSALFGRKIRGTETYRAACDFWKNCAREHTARYGNGKPR